MSLVAVLSLLLAAPAAGDDVQSQLWSNMMIVGATRNHAPAVGAQTSASWLDSLKVLNVGASTSEEVVADEVCNVGINAACGGRKKCCDDLACSPVWDDSENKFLAKCVVTDASLLDVTSCYQGDQKCFYHYQCCSHRCNDADGDNIFTCDKMGGASSASPAPTDTSAASTDATDATTIATSSTPQAETTEEQQEAGEQPEERGGRTNFESSWGSVDSKLPLSFIVLSGIVAFVLLGVAILKVAQKISRQQYQALGVDKIPSPGRALRYDAEDWTILNKGKTGGGPQLLDTDSETETEPIPVLPARDYTSGERQGAAFSPTVPIVDY